MKKLTAIVLTLTMLFALAACGEKPTAEPETTAKQEATAEDSANPINTNLTATDADFDVLAATVFGFVRCMPYFEPVFGERADDADFVSLVRNSTPEDYEDAYFYNSKSENALGDAMHMIFNTSGMGFLNYIDDMNIEVEQEIISKYDENGNLVDMMPDPLNQYTDSFGYIKFGADGIDFILKNILCVEPDRTKTDDDFDSARYSTLFNYYYYDGYYYYEYDEGGGGDPFPNIVDYEQQPDGSYIVKLSNYNDSDTVEYMPYGDIINENYVYTIYEVSAALKEIDGQKIWSVSYLKPAEYVVYVDTI